LGRHFSGKVKKKLGSRLFHENWENRLWHKRVIWKGYQGRGLYHGGKLRKHLPFRRVLGKKGNSGRKEMTRIFKGKKSPRRKFVSGRKGIIGKGRGEGNCPGR